MRNIHVTTVADRLLYGPDKPDLHLQSLAKTAATSPTDSAATSPTLASSSPTETDPKSKFSVTESVATSSIESEQSSPVAPTEGLHNSDQSATSSPTIANASPVDLPSKQHYYAREVEIGSPTSTSSAPAPTGETPTQHIGDGTNSSDSDVPSQSTRRNAHQLFRSWRSTWSPPPYAWHPTALQMRPLAGILGILVAIVCAVASLAVLLVSDGQATSDWYVSPAVLLAIITALANSAIALAYMEAVPVSFWYSMTRGRTVRSLERQWQISRSILYVSRIY